MAGVALTLSQTWAPSLTLPFISLSQGWPGDLWTLAGWYIEGD